jgi:hypothetical protein
MENSLNFKKSFIQEKNAIQKNNFNQNYPSFDQKEQSKDIFQIENPKITNIFLQSNNLK